MFFKSKLYIFLFLFSFSIFLFLVLTVKDRAFFVRDDYSVLQVASDFSFKKIFLPHAEHFYPLSRLLFWLQFDFFKLDFFKYLRVNFFYHLLNIWLVFFILKGITKDKMVALFGFMAAFIGSSYKVFITLANQTWVLEAFFSLVSLLFLILFYQKKKLIFYWLSILGGILALLTYTVGFAVLVVVFLTTILFFSKQNKLAFFVLILFLFFAGLFFTFADKSYLSPNIKMFDLNNLIACLRIVAAGFWSGAFLGQVFPWVYFFNSHILNYFLIFLILGFLILFFIRSRKKPSFLNKSNRFYSSLIFLFVLFHFFIIGWVRNSNLGYALSPQYNYFPRVLFIIGLFFGLNIYFLKNKHFKKRRLNLLFLISLWFLVNQSFYFIHEVNRWEKRALYTKKYINNLGYIFSKSYPVLDLNLPDSISPDLKYSDFNYLFFPEKKVIFLKKEDIDKEKYLRLIESDKKIYRFYNRAFSGFDIKHY